MTREFVYLETFDKNWKALGMTDDDLLELEQFILGNPSAGRVIRGTGGVRKLRVSVEDDKGKSGGARVLYVDFASHEKTLVLNVYSKKWRDNISMSERAEYKRLVADLLRHIKGGE